MTSPSWSAEHTNELIHYDGVYRGTPEMPNLHPEGNRLDSPICDYLRFYPDGTVITVASFCKEGDLIKIKEWFDKENKKINRGNFTIHERKISFSFVYGASRVYYSGEVSDATIHLEHFTNSNEHRNTDNYVFIKW